MVKNILILIFLMIGINSANAQFMRSRGNYNIAGSFFGSDTGKGLRLDYSKYLSPTLLINPALFYEWGYPMQSNYNNIGADFMIGVIPFDLGEKLNFSLHAGLTGGYESLVGLQNNINGFSGGIKGGVQIEFLASEGISIMTYAHQAYLLKKVFGNSYYHIGLGIKFNLYNY